MYDHGVRYPLIEIPLAISSGTIRHSKAVYVMDVLESLGFPNDKFFSWDGNVFARPATGPANIKSLQTEMENHSYFGQAQLYIGIKDEASVGELVDVKNFIKNVVRGDTWKD